MLIQGEIIEYKNGDIRPTFFAFLFSWNNHVYPKYCQHCKKDDSQWTQRLYLWKLLKQIGFIKQSSYNSIKRLKRKDLLLLAIKLAEKIADPSNSKEYYNPYVKRKKTQNQ